MEGTAFDVFVGGPVRRFMGCPVYVLKSWCEVTTTYEALYCDFGEMEKARDEEPRRYPFFLFAALTPFRFKICLDNWIVSSLIPIPATTCRLSNP